MRGFIVAIFVILPQVYAVNIDSNTIIKSCCDVAVKSGSYFKLATRQSGVYNIIDFCVQGPLIKGYCDAVTDGGGWLVVQRRQQNSFGEDFNKFWSDYESGFGHLNSEFWYGLRSLHRLTRIGTWELRIDFTLNGITSYLHYNNFKVGPAHDNYQLSISGFIGITPTDPFAYHNGQQFTTRDRDNDRKSNGNCAVDAYGSTAAGGWWYNNCFYVNLNKKYRGPHGFMYLAGTWNSPSFIEMKIRPTNCNY